MSFITFISVCFYVLLSESLITFFCGSMTSARGTSSLAADSFRAFAARRPRVILGSSSPWRRHVLEDLATRFDFKFEVMAPEIDEKAIRFDEPEKLVIAIAHAKAKEIMNRLKQSGNGDGEAFILTGDQVRRQGMSQGLFGNENKIWLFVWKKNYYDDMV